MTQKSKNILLIIGFFMVLVVAYKYAIANTLQLRTDYRRLKKEALVFDNIPLQLSSLKQREIYYDSLLNKYQLNDGSIQNSMLKTISVYAKVNGLKVIDFIEPHKVEQNDFTISTYQFTLRGNYNDIVTLVHQLEQQTKFGEIINLNFKKQKDHKTGNYYLLASILLKSLG